MGDKPRVFVPRIGKNGPKRPVKVTFSTPSTAQRTLPQAKQLLFIGPDRSVEERTQNKLLVQELHRRGTEQPTKRHLIRGGAVRTEDTDSTTLLLP